MWCMCSVRSSCCVQSMLAESIWYSVPALVYMCVWFNDENVSYMEPIPDPVSNVWSWVMMQLCTT